MLRLVLRRSALATTRAVRPRSPAPSMMRSFSSDSKDPTDLPKKIENEMRTGFKNIESLILGMKAEEKLKAQEIKKVIVDLDARMEDERIRRSTINRQNLEVRIAFLIFGLEFVVHYWLSLGDVSRVGLVWCWRKLVAWVVLAYVWLKSLGADCVARVKDLMTMD